MKILCSTLLLLVATASAPVAASGETFRNPVRIPTTSDPVGVFVADLNNDGRPDIMWGGSGTPTNPGVLHTLLAQASGGYVAGPTMTMPANVTAVCLPADETGDGIVDIVCPSVYQYTASLYTFPGKGDGSFGAPIITQIPSLPNNGAYDVVVVYPLADLNGDGVADLIIMELETQSGYVMLGDGHGNFTKSSIIYGSGTPQVIDVNGDGKADILFTNGSVWLGKGDGTFTQAPTSLPIYGPCIFHDMDGDGKPDAVCGSLEAVNGDITGGTQLLIFQGEGDGTFNPAPIKTITYGDHSNEFNGEGTFETPFAVVDLNGDGVLDILAEAGDGFTVILGQGQLAFDYPAHYATGYLASAANVGIAGEFATQIADMNGDKLPDLVNVGPNGIYITYARKDGTLDTASAYEVTQVIGYQTLADFNEDGIPDIAATGDASIELNLGKGDGTFQAPVALSNGGIDFSTPLSATNAHILHGDFNGDHHQDILAIGSPGIYEYDSYILFGDGKGSFTNPQLVPNTSELFPMYDSRQVADLNGDGRDDLFNNDYSDLYAYLSNGDGTFTTVTTTIPSNSGQSGFSSTAALADFNHDGKLDAVWAAAPNVLVCKGHGDGTFDSSCLSLPIPTSISSNVSGAAVTAGDFDGDGNQDFALLLDLQTPTIASAAYVFYGAGDGTFSSGVLAGEFDHSYTGIYSADLNNDGLAGLILKTSGSLGYGCAVGIVNSLPHRSFDSEVNYYAGTGLADISIADLNHDGFLDLLSSNGDYNVRASSVTVLMNNGKVSSSVTLSSSLNPAPLGGAVTFTASISSSLSVVEPTDTVTFFDGQTQLGAVPVGQGLTAAYTTSGLGFGSHSITAVYSGNAQILGSTSPAITESIVYFTGDFSIQSTPPAATVMAGQAATFQVGITPSGGFNAPLTFTCSGLPAFATCAFSPSTLSSGQGQVSLKIQTASSTQSASLAYPSKLRTGRATAVLVGLLFCLLPRGPRRKRFARFFVFVAVSFVALLATSCGGGGGGGGGGSGNGNQTPAGSYQLTITAQTNEPSQNISHSVTIGLTVQ